MTYGLIHYLDKYISYIHLGDNRNIFRKLLGAFNIMRGKGSYLFETIAEAGTGKTEENITVFSRMIPEQYIFKKNEMTLASFTRYSKISNSYFDRMIINFGDFGSSKAFLKVEDIFNVGKILITDGEYSRDVAERESDGNYENLSLTLECESFGAVYTSITNEFTERDSQLISRTLEFTPPEIDQGEIIDFIGLLNSKATKESILYQESILELKEFQEYLLSLVNVEYEVINPYVNVFKRYSMKSDISEIREFKQQMELFDAYCHLTIHECHEYESEDGTVKYIATENQLIDYFSSIALENTLTPYQNDFLKYVNG